MGSFLGVQGTCDLHADSPNQIVDFQANFLDPDNPLEAGMTVVNVSDSSQSIILAILDSNTLLTEPLEGGYSNTWSFGNQYRIYLQSQGLGSKLDVTYSVANTVRFSCRIIDARVGARKREYDIQRTGVTVDYRNAYKQKSIDIYRGTNPISEDEFKMKYRTPEGPRSDFMKENPFAVNMELKFAPVQKMKVLLFGPNENVIQGLYGIITQGKAILGASLQHPFRKGDVFKIHDKWWQISEPPEFEFSRGREILGYRLQVVEIGHMKVDW